MIYLAVREYIQEEVYGSRHFGRRYTHPTHQVRGQFCGKGSIKRLDHRPSPLGTRSYSHKKSNNIRNLSALAGSQFKLTVLT